MLVVHGAVAEQKLVVPLELWGRRRRRSRHVRIVFQAGSPLRVSLAQFRRDLLEDRCDAPAIGLDQRGELIGRLRDDRETELGEPLLNRGIAQRDIEFAI